MKLIHNEIVSGPQVNSATMIKENFNILVVDDSKAVRAFFKDIFEKKPQFIAQFASCGEEAVEIFRNNVSIGDRPFDFMLTDINMPGLDGFETIDAVKNIDPEIKVGMITGFNVDDYIKMALERGVYNIICKMDAPNEIVQTMENLITGDNLFGICSYIDKGSSYERREINETQDLKRVVNEILEFASAYLDDEKIYGLKTGLVEMGTNA
ncbi:MAG TPA: response regulator transcription factor, partial [bacterium]|nr:response regulator transcription factor [bacterium]